MVIARVWPCSEVIGVRQANMSHAQFRQVVWTDGVRALTWLTVTYHLRKASGFDVTISDTCCYVESSFGSALG